jgi:hypothetical protein
MANGYGYGYGYSGFELYVAALSQHKGHEGK